MRNAVLSQHTANFEPRRPARLDERAPAEFDELIRVQREAFERAEDEEIGVRHPWFTRLALVPMVLVCIAAGFAGALAIDPVNPFGSLAVPRGLVHPYALAAPVAIIYGLLGLAGWLAFRRRDDDLRIFVGSAMSAFRVVPLLGILWTVALFGLHSPIISLGLGILLVGAVVIAMIRFAPLSRGAGLLLLPILAAATSAATFSGVLIALNPEAPLLALSIG